VDAGSIDVPQDRPETRPMQGRPFRNTNQCSAERVHLMETRAICNGDRCSPNHMGRLTGIYIPTILSDKQVPAETGEGPLGNPADCHDMAATAMVSTATGGIDRDAHPAPKQSVHRPIWSVSSNDPGPIPPTRCMETIRRRFTQADISKQA